MRTLVVPVLKTISKKIYFMHFVLLYGSNGAVSAVIM
jgi:hypothetical protein